MLIALKYLSRCGRFFGLETYENYMSAGQQQVQNQDISLPAFRAGLGFEWSKTPNTPGYLGMRNFSSVEGQVLEKKVST